MSVLNLSAPSVPCALDPVPEEVELAIPSAEAPATAPVAGPSWQNWYRFKARVEGELELMRRACTFVVVFAMGLALFCGLIGMTMDLISLAFSRWRQDSDGEVMFLLSEILLRFILG